MTPKERLEKIISKDSLQMRMARFKYGNGEPRLFAHEELIKLPVDFSVGRKTPKSDFLKRLELTQRMSKCKDSEIVNELLGFCAEQHMIDVFTGLHQY